MRTPDAQLKAAVMALIEKAAGEDEKRRDGVWRGPVATPHYHALLSRVREGKERCSGCGAAERLLVHHVDGDGRNDADENLQVLCDACHRAMPDGPHARPAELAAEASVRAMLTKHLEGQHDQSTHGGEAGRGSEDANTPPATVYHGTTIRIAVDRILKDGLRLGDAWQDRKPSVYFTPDEQKAKSYALVRGGQRFGAVVEFEMPANMADSVIEDEVDMHNAFRLEKPIPAEHIKAIYLYGEDGTRRETFENPSYRSNKAAAEIMFAPVVLDVGTAGAKHLEGQHDQSSHGRGGDQPASPGARGRIETLARSVKTVKAEFTKRASEVKQALDAAESANTDREYDRMFASWRERDQQYEQVFLRAESRWQKAKAVLEGMVDFMLAKGEDGKLEAAIAEAEAAAGEMQGAVDGMAELLAEIKRGPSGQSTGDTTKAARVPLRRGGLPITRKQLHSLHVKRHDLNEKAMAKTLAGFFSGVVDEVAGKLAAKGGTAKGDDPEAEAARLINSVWNEDAHLEELVKTIKEPMARAFADGALTEYELGKRARKAMEARVQQKHLEGQHDQSTHGRAGEGGAGSSEEFRQRQQETPEFKAWFGESKVVDEDGKPLVVYHGTRGEFNEFKPDTENAWSDALGFDTYFHSEGKATASTYASQFEDGKVMENYLSIQKPLEIDARGGDWTDAIAEAVDNIPTYRTEEERRYQEAKQEFRDKYYWEIREAEDQIPPEATAEMERRSREMDQHILDNPSLYRNAKRKPFGYDGIIVKNVMDMTAAGVGDDIDSYNPFTTVYVAFKGSQIKSATSNSGTFDPNTADITKAVETKSTASDLLEELGIDWPEAFGTEVPQWVVKAATDAMVAAFEEDYWQDVIEGTRVDLMGTLQHGIREGVSIRDLADEIKEIRGEEYAKWRATATARTETTNMLSAGHVAGIRQTGEETGLPMTKVWNSVFGSTSRQDHMDADGQERELDGEFDIGGEPARWPGDERLSAKQRIQCQCFTLSGIADSELSPDEQPSEEEPPSEASVLSMLAKHLEGQHDQGTHAGEHGAAAPAEVPTYDEAKLGSAVETLKPVDFHAHPAEELHAKIPGWQNPAKWQQRTYGGVIVNEEGKVLLREPSGHYGGYTWTLPKGKMDSEDEHPLAVANREVAEETGHEVQPIGAVPGEFRRHGGTWSHHYFLMRSTGQDPEHMDKETASTKWFSYKDAREAIMLTKDKGGMKRDLAVLDAGFKELNRMAKKYGKKGLSLAAVDEVLAAITKAMQDGCRGCGRDAEAEVLDMLRKHLQGEHDQQSHGRLGEHTHEQAESEAEPVPEPIIPKPEVPPLKQTSVIDNSKWPAHNACAKGCTKKILAMEAAAAAGDKAAILAVQEFTKNPNSYQKAVNEVKAALLEQMGDVPKGIDEAAQQPPPAPETAAEYMADLAADNATAGQQGPEAAEPPTQQWDADDPNVGLMTGYKKIGGVLGTQPGGTYETPGGVKAYIKFPKDPNVARAEVLADKLYKLAGATVVQAQLVESEDGKLGIATKWEETTHNDWNDPAVKAAAAEDFAIHAWLGNWDCIGAGSENPMDNIRMASDGAQMIVDAGGSLNYKGTGGQKPPGAFGETVNEWDTLRDSSINPSAAKVFEDMTPEQLIASGKKLYGIETAQIKDLVDKYHGGTQAEKDAMVKLLDKRRDDIAIKVSKLEAEKYAKEQGLPAPTSTPPKPIVKPTGETVESKPIGPAVPPPPHIASATNQHMQKKLDAIYEAAKTGDPAAVEAVKTNATSGSTYVKMAHQYKQSVLAAMGAGGAVSATHEAVVKAAAAVTPPVAQAPPKIDPTEFPAIPEFVSSNKANVAQNLEYCKQLVKLAQDGDLDGVKTLQLPASPKLNAFRSELASNLASQLNPPPPPMKVHGAIKEIIDKVKVVIGNNAKKLGKYLSLAELSSLPANLKSGTQMLTGTWSKGHAAWKKLGSSLAEAIANYTGGDYHGMNDSLRSHAPTQEALDAANGVMKAAYELPSGYVLQRSHGLSGKDLEDFKPGKVVQEPGIVSTSTRDDWFWDGNVRMRLTLGEGVRGLPVKSFSHNSSEDEVLLPPNTRIMVTGRKEKGGYVYIDAHVLPFDPGQCCPP